MSKGFSEVAWHQDSEDAEALLWGRWVKVNSSVRVTEGCWETWKKQLWREFCKLLGDALEPGEGLSKVRVQEKFCGSHEVAHGTHTSGESAPSSC